MRCPIAACCLLVLTAAGPSPSPPPLPPATAQTPTSPVEQTINSLQSELKITSAQMPQWNAFAQVMRDNAASTDTSFSQRAGAVPSMNAEQNMQSYAALVHAYADNVGKLAAAFAALYDVLSDQQKQLADTLFRQQPVTGAPPNGHSP